MDRLQNRLNGIRPLLDKLEAITKAEKPKKNKKELKTFRGAIQNLSKYLENLSAQTDMQKKLVEKKTKKVDMDK